MKKRYVSVIALIAAACLCALCAHAHCDGECPICLLRAAVGAALPLMRAAAAAAACALYAAACPRRTRQARTVVTDKVVMLS